MTAPVLELRGLVEALPRTGRRRCGASTSPSRTASSSRRRPVRLRQVDAAPRDGHARPADVGAGRARGRTSTPPRSTTGTWPRCGRGGSASSSSSSSSSDGLSALDNVADGLLYAGVAGGRARDAGARAPWSGSGSATGSTHHPAQLSGGERQRVAIARALVGEPGDRARRRADRQPRLGHGRRDRRPAPRAERRRARRSSSSRTTARSRQRCRGASSCATVGSSTTRARRYDERARAPAGSSRRDVLRVGGVGLRTRRLRAALSALGIAIGIAAMVAVLGISASSQADLTRPSTGSGRTCSPWLRDRPIFGEEATLPDEAPAMIGRIGPVEQVAATRCPSTPPSAGTTSSRPPRPAGSRVLAADTDLLETLGGRCGPARS